MKYLYAYWNIAIPANIITAALCYQAWMLENDSALGILVWVKIITFIVLASYIYIFKSSTLIFFMNLGMSKIRFYASMFLIDVSVFIASISLILLMK